MRNIGSIDNEQKAVLAGAYLLAGGVECRIEAGGAEDWQVWVLDEDKLAQGQTLLSEFMDSPDSNRIAQAEQKAQQMIARAEQAQEDYVKRQVDMRERWSRMMRGPAPLTYILMAICVILWGAQTINPDLLEFYDKWLLIGWPGVPVLAQVESGEVWRLITPAFLHAPIRFPDGEFYLMGGLHILFNMMWLKDLGPIIERMENSWKLLLLVIVCAVVPNVMQYLLVGPVFYGFSGVVYGLLGYLWIRTRFDPGYGIRLNPQIVWFMIAWMVMGFLGFMNMANWAHLGGLLCGGAIGYLGAAMRRVR